MTKYGVDPHSGRSTSKYHISPTTGRPNKCTASVSACPLGGPHYPTKEAATLAAQELAARGRSAVPAAQRRTPAAKSDSLAALRGEDGRIDLNSLPEEVKEDLLKLLAQERGLKSPGDLLAKEAAAAPPQPRREPPKAVLKEPPAPLPSAKKPAQLPVSYVLQHTDLEEGKQWGPPGNAFGAVAYEGYSGGITFEYSHPCQEGDEEQAAQCANDYCRCGRYTGGVESFDEEKFAHGIFMKLNHRGVRDALKKNEQDAYRQVKEVLERRGLLDPYNYTPVSHGGYYGEELDNVHCSGDVAGALKDLKKLQAGNTLPEAVGEDSEEVEAPLPKRRRPTLSHPYSAMTVREIVDAPKLYSGPQGYMNRYKDPFSKAAGEEVGFEYSRPCQEGDEEAAAQCADDYCRCGRYTGRVKSFNSRKLLGAVYKDLVGGASDLPLNDDQRRLNRKLSEVMEKHGLLDRKNYRPVAVGGYYGEELSHVECLGDYEGALRELRAYYNRSR